MQKKSGGEERGGTTNGGKGTASASGRPKPNLSSDPMDTGTMMNPRATLEAVAAVVVQPQPLGPTSAPGKPKEPELDPKKVLDSSTYNSGKKVAQRLTQLPGVWHGGIGPEEEGPPPEVPVFDGNTPAPELTDRDLWKAIAPPVQSREDKRSAELYEQAIFQFAVGNNPRYEPDEGGKSRGHIFVWDVTRAMNAEIPHMLGARELSLNQTIDWLRFEGSHRGWVKMAVDRALEAANEGRPVIVIARDIKAKPQLIGVVRPGGRRPDNHPRIAAAGKSTGNDLTPPEALGVHAVEYYSHP